MPKTTPNSPKQPSCLWIAVTTAAALVASLLLASCGPATPSPEPSSPPAAVISPTPSPTPAHTSAPAPSPSPTPVPRLGAWLDTVIVVEEPSEDAAVARLKAGDIDLALHLIADAALVESVKASPDLRYTEAVGSYAEIFFNPVGPTFAATGALNPFSVPRIREAMNWLVDRDYLVDELLGGLGRKRFLPIVTSFPDYARYAGVARELEAKYAHDPDRARAVISQEMETLGAERVDGTWHFGGEPVALIFVIRVEDERREVGDYVANLLEGAGFTVDRQYKTGAEASPIWVYSEPGEGLWHLYTGGWLTTRILRDEGANFDFFYMPRGLPFPAWQAFQPVPEFDEVAGRLGRNDFSTMEERAGLFARALRLSLENSQHIWLYDCTSFTPRRAGVDVTADLAGSVAGAWLWPYTLRWQGQVGGEMTLAAPDLLLSPWNPLGTSSAYDSALMRATGDWAVMPDPYTGLHLPQRLESAEVHVKEGLPVGRTLDWVRLQFVTENQVPDDAWVDWDAAGQRFLTAAEVYTRTGTANMKVVCRYPSALYQTTWHDGSPFTLADTLLRMILQFDRAKESSPLYDEAALGATQPFLQSFKGWRIAQQDPLVVEYYTDQYTLDAETAVTDLACAYPQYYEGSHGAWHMMGLGLLAEAAGQLAFSADKAEALEIEQMSYVAGPGLEVLAGYLDQAAAGTYIPYEPALGQYITAGEAEARWARYADWYRDRGHLWIGNGPYYLDAVHPVQGTVVLKRFAGYPDPADRWSGYAVPRIAEVEVSGPEQVTAGTEAAFDVSITFEGEPYPLADITEVKYLVFGATGELILSGVAEPVQDGSYEIVISGDQTTGLKGGSSRLEVIVVPVVVSIPTFESFQFVTTP